METTASFGYWVRRQRKTLDLTQRTLANRVGCSVAMLKKIEMDERRPSRLMAERLADCLAIPADQRKAFVECGRGLKPVDTLPMGIPSAVTPDYKSSIIPAEATPFIGRTAERAKIADDLRNPECRLLTIVGPGGIGKTRLALRAAAEAADFRDGVCYVPLAAIASPDLIAGAILHQLDVPLPGEVKPDEQLLSLLSSREMMLVLDNFEHLLTAPAVANEAATSLLSRILRTCRSVKLLVTSRERLNLQEEWLLPLEGLTRPEEAISLFVHSAQRVKPSFNHQGKEVAMVEICKSVDGLPLAIELAAAWTQVMSCEQIADQIQHSNNLLTSRLRNIPERHRSLQALFDHSWSLLSEEERNTFMKLSVFQGGFFIEEAVEVCGAQLPMLLSLVEKSLVHASEEGRYDLHELAQRFAAERLAASGEMETTRKRHFEAFLSLAETAYSNLVRPGAPQWIKRLDMEQGNLGAAWDWAVGQADKGNISRLAFPMTFYWNLRGYWLEGARRFEQVIQHFPKEESPELALAQLGYATFLGRSGRLDEAQPYLEEAYSLAQKLKIPYVLGMASAIIGRFIQGTEARKLFINQAITLFRQTSSKPLLASTLIVLGDELRAQGAIDAARAAYDESLSLCREMGYIVEIINPLGNLGRLNLLEGDIAGAQRIFTECVETCRHTGNRLGLVNWLLRLGVVQLYLGEPAQSRLTIQEALDLANEIAYQDIIPNVLTWLAMVALAEGEVKTAEAYLSQSLAAFSTLFWRGSDKGAISPRNWERLDFVEALAAAARLRVLQEQPDSAVIWLSCAEKIQENNHFLLEPPLQKIVDDLRTSLQVTLGKSGFDEAWKRGQVIQVNELLGL